MTHADQTTTLNFSAITDVEKSVILWDQISSIANFQPTGEFGSAQIYLPRFNKVIIAIQSPDPANRLGYTELTPQGFIYVEVCSASIRHEVFHVLELLTGVHSLLSAAEIDPSEYGATVLAACRLDEICVITRFLAFVATQNMPDYESNSSGGAPAL